MKDMHIPILRAFDDLKFNLGKRTLIDFLKGNPNPTIDRNNLDELNSYGCLFMKDKEDIEEVVNQLIKGKYLEFNTIAGGFQVVKRTSLGIKEIFEKKFVLKEKKTKKIKNLFEETKITDEDRKLFQSFDFFIGNYNDEQKKAIISPEKNLLCVAGAGSGKTTVLTKRIEFLTKFRSVKEKNILAVTFTKKAKEEMQIRLAKLGIQEARVETFNSFCEKILKKHGHEIYEQEVRVAQYRDKIAIVKNVMNKLSMKFDVFYDEYFNKKQVREKSADELFFIFVNDIFTVIDYYKNTEEEMKPFYELENNGAKRRVAKIVHDIAKEVSRQLRSKGLRDFSDQITDSLELFRKKPEMIPEFEHVLVDEFQDVNHVQFEFLKTLSPPNIFAVGDPRQAIYGWRGSDINYILNFQQEFKGTQVIMLKKNYRSTKEIVDLFNLSIKGMGLADLESADESESKDKNIHLIEHDNEKLEQVFVLEAIKNSKNPRNEIFVLARTNKILENYAEIFSQNGIKYTIKSEEEYKNGEPQEDEIVLATVHSIKGMEAKEVYVVNANSLSFPNKVQDNFVFALMKNDNDYDKESEELRLFYVALSRAKEKLVITFTGNYSKFITKEMLEILDYKGKNKSIFDYSNKKLDSGNLSVLQNMLRDWRTDKSNATGLPVYMIISNKAIEELAMYRPQNKIEMLNVNGLGDMKIAKYGDELLKIVNG